MIGAVHAGIGAAIGSFCDSSVAAFAAGILSHLAADAVPHRDYPAHIEVPLLAAALLAIGKARGHDSPEFWGALGAISPDLEHGIAIAAGRGFSNQKFPTHMKDGRYHGRDSGERWSQLIVAAASVMVLVLSNPENK